MPRALFRRSVATWWRACVTIALLAAPAAHATITPDPTGVWHVPESPGSGVSIVQQGDTLFIAIFDYDEQKRPVWFVARNVKWTGLHLDPTGWLPHEGDLYETRGGWFGQAYDPSSSGLTRVGTVRLYQTSGSLERNIALTYSVNGVAVSRQLKPLGFGNEQRNFTGNFHIVTSTVGIPESNCPAENGAKGTLTAMPAPGGMNVTVLEPIRLPGGVTCSAAGTFAAAGNRARFRGNLQCAGQSAGTIELDNVAITESGFLGWFKVTGAVCTHVGSISGLRILPTL